MPTKSFPLEHLLAPTAPETFFRDSWEQRPLVISRSAKDHYAGLLSLSDVDRIIAFSRPKFSDTSAFESAPPARPTFVRGSLEHLAVSPADNPGIAELRQVFFTQGKSVVIMAMQHRWPAVAQLCRNLECVFHCPVHANLYLTPAGSQGFPAHFDPHEVLILQLEGAKDWRLYGPTEELPLASEKEGIPRIPLGSGRDVRLQAGDLLYIPRGHVHEASTSDSYSLHLTVGINVYRWADLLNHALSNAAREDVRFRESLPGGAVPGDRSALKQQFQNLLQRLAGHASREGFFENAVDSLGDGFFHQLTMLPGNHFASQADLEQIDLETVLEKPPHTICRVIQNEQGAAIEFPGNRVCGPQRVASALRFVSTASRFAVRDLPDVLNAGSKLVLARRLVREGLLTRVGQAGLASTGQATGAAFERQPRVGSNPNAEDANADTMPRITDWEKHETMQPTRQTEAIVES